MDFRAKVVQGYDHWITFRYSETDAEVREYKFRFECDVLDPLNPEDTYSEQERSLADMLLRVASEAMLQYASDNSIAFGYQHTERYTETTNRSFESVDLPITPPEEPTP